MTLRERLNFHLQEFQSVEAIPEDETARRQEVFSTVKDYFIKHLEVHFPERLEEIKPLDSLNNTDFEASNQTIDAYKKVIESILETVPSSKLDDDKINGSSSNLEPA